MKRPLLTMPMLLAATAVGAVAPERSISLDTARLETIRLEGQVQTWRIDKVCIDGQVYLMVLGTSAPGAIAPAFKDGKPEQCQLKPAKSP